MEKIEQSRHNLQFNLVVMEFYNLMFEFVIFRFFVNVRSQEFRVVINDGTT